MADPELELKGGGGGGTPATAGDDEFKEVDFHFAASDLYISYISTSDLILS